jgi:hypothetical protein
MIWGDTRGFPGERRREGRVVTGRPTGDDAVSLDTSVPHIARVYDYWPLRQGQLRGGPRGGRAGHRRAPGNPAQRPRAAGVPGPCGALPGPEGATAYIDADLRDTGTILERAADVLDFGQPVAVILLGILQGIPDQEDPGAIVGRLMDAVPPGSYLAISQIASDVAADEVAEGVQRYNADRCPPPVAPRTQAEVCGFFAGLELLEPGIVQVHRWRPGTGDLGSGRNLAIYAGVGRKP